MFAYHCVMQSSNFRNIICYIHNTNKQAKMNIENDDADLRKLLKPVVVVVFFWITGNKIFNCRLCIKSPTWRECIPHYHEYRSTDFYQSCHSQFFWNQYSYKRKRCFAKTLKKGNGRLLLRALSSCSGKMSGPKQNCLLKPR